MICINLSSLDPYFNLATEEYLLKSFSEDILMLWQSEPSVIVGKHQNMMAEVNFPYIHAQKIPVIRRLSGGGTVFHDLGNVNFTYIVNGKQGHLVDFARFTSPLIDYLNSLGVPATLSGRNDILVNGFKFSGNAEHVFKNRVMHHGTILFNSDLDQLRLGIKSSEGEFVDSSVKSFRSKVANLAPLFGKKATAEQFRLNFFDHLLGMFRSSVYELTDKDRLLINQLVEAKYSTWEWNYGYSPDYTFISKPDSDIMMELKVKRGIISDARLIKSSKKVDESTVSKLIGLPHDSFDGICKLFLSDCSCLIKSCSEVASVMY